MTLLTDVISNHRSLSRCSTWLVLIFVLGFFQTQANDSAHASLRGLVRNPAGQPLSGAQILITAITPEFHATADANGVFEILSIPLVGEFQRVTIAIQAQGYGTYTLNNVILYAGDTLILDTLQLYPQDQTMDAGGLPDELIPPPSQFNQSLSRTAAAAGISPLFFSHDTIPPTIRVAITGFANCGYWSNGQYILYPIIRVDTLDFRDYAKGVLPHEWITSWNAASLRAGAMAVKMYAWFKINIGPRGVWNGQPYDVRADTCDQVYTGTTYASTNAAVDDTWNLMMRRNNKVIEIHYVDGIAATCAGTFPGKPCMEQWGSKSLGDQGWDWQSILHYYYDPVDITGYITGGYTIPNAGAVLGNSGYLAGIASADAGVREVHFTANWGGLWRLLGIDFTPPYEYHWDLCAAGVSNGAVILGFDVIDNNGSIVYSPQGTRAITVSADCSQPRGGLTSPLNGVSVQNRVSLGAWAAANAGVQEVRFIASWPGKTPFIIYRDSVAPYAYTWDLCAEDIPDGVITLNIEIMERGGAVAISPTGSRAITKAYTCPQTNAPRRNVWTLRTPTLTWNRVTGAARYEIQIAGNTNFNSLVYSDAALSSEVFQTTLPELRNGTYYWRVRACTSPTLCGTWSAVESFVIDVP